MRLSTFCGLHRDTEHLYSLQDKYNNSRGRCYNNNCQPRTNTTNIEARVIFFVDFYIELIFHEADAIIYVHTTGRNTYFKKVEARTVCARVRDSDVRKAATSCSVTGSDTPPPPPLPHPNSCKWPGQAHFAHLLCP
jgi:hypothetical protein